MTTNNGPDGPSAIGAPRLISLAEAAERLGVSRGMVWKLRSAGALRCVAIGRRVLVTEAELARFAAEGGSR